MRIKDSGRAQNRMGGERKQEEKMKRRREKEEYMI